jgi:hypothetical protein
VIAAAIAASIVLSIAMFAWIIKKWNDMDFF